MRSPITGEDLTFDFGFYVVNKKTEQVALNSLTTVVSKVNVGLAKTLLNSCKNLSKKYLKKKIKAKLKRLSYIKKRLVKRPCSDSKKRVKKLKKEINTNLVQIPDYINACK